ncbi:MAG: hypothetical protein ABW202_03835 [Duganella sp.]
MADLKVLADHFGVILEAHKKLPDDRHRLQFLAGLAELEDNLSHKTRQFPVTRLHKVVGTKKAIYRADVDKISGWRFHIQYLSGQLHLKDLIAGSLHNHVLEVIQSKWGRYT